MLLTRALLTCLTFSPLWAAPRAVVLGVWGTVPGAPTEKMTEEWREGAKSVKAYEWISLDESVEQLKKRPGCQTMGPACRGRISRQAGADVLFFARHFFWGVALEQIDVKTGSQERKAKVPMEETGDALVATFKEAGVRFVQKSAPEPDAAPAAAATTAPAPAPAATPAPAPTPPPAPAPAPTPAETAKAEPAVEEPAAEKPVAPEEPVAEKPVAEEPAAEEPAGGEPAAEEAEVAFQKAMVLGVWGPVPGPHEQMTQALRERASKIDGYQWVSGDESIEELKKRPGCKQIGLACRDRISKEAGAEVLFFGRHYFWGVAFEEIDVKTGTQKRKTKIKIAEVGNALVTRCTEAGAGFIQESALVAAQPPRKVQLPIRSPQPPYRLEPAWVGPPRRPKAATGAEANAAVLAEPPEPSMFSKVRLRTWLAAGGAGALLASGTVVGILARLADDDYNDPGRGCLTATQVSACKDLERKAENRALAANILFVAGGVAAVGAGTLFYLDVTHEEASIQLALNF